MASTTLSALDAYNTFAPWYGAYAASRRQYRQAIDNVVVGRIRNAKSLLDVGAGDGGRAIGIGRSLGAQRVVLLEPSPGMRSEIPAGYEVWPFGIEEIPEGREAFALITCLWNVLGHVQGHQQRVRALLNLRHLLAPKGMIFLDVIHRYNAAAYGWSKTVGRLVHDAFVRSEKNGDVLVSWQAGARTIHTQSHVFTSAEMDALFRAAGLKTLQRWVIHYDTGAVCRLPFNGHLCYQLGSTQTVP